MKTTLQSKFAVKSVSLREVKKYTLVLISDEEKVILQASKKDDFLREKYENANCDFRCLYSALRYCNKR